MLVTYDSAADAAYIHLQDSPLVAKSIVVDEDRVVDVDGQGRAVGIEVLGASAAFEVADLIERFHLEDRAHELLQAVREFVPAASA